VIYTRAYRSAKVVAQRLRWVMIKDVHQASLVDAIKKIDVVISAVKGPQLTDHLNIIKAMEAERIPCT